MHEHLIDTGKGVFKLEELGPLLAGMAEIMPLVGDRMWRCYHAGRAQNRPLAAFQLKEAVNLMKKGGVLRPKYADNIDSFIKAKMTPVSRVIESEDWSRFDEVFQLMVDAANAYHAYYDKPYLRWRVSPSAPTDMDMTPNPGR